MGGISSTLNFSQQNANANLAQQYSGSCSVECNNKISDVDISFINSNIGGNLEISQTCSANGQCMFNNTMDAVSDVLYKASNSANAGNAAGLIPNFNQDDAQNYSYQKIQQSVNQYISQKCNVSSANSMDNVQIFAANSNIGGNVVIGQQGEATGNCQLDSSMTASAYASGTIDNCAMTGKKVGMKKCSAGKGGMSIASIVGVVVAFIVVIMVIMMISKAVTARSGGVGPSSTSSKIFTGIGNTPKINAVETK